MGPWVAVLLFSRQPAALKAFGTAFALILVQCRKHSCACTVCHHGMYMCRWFVLTVPHSLCCSQPTIHPATQAERGTPRAVALPAGVSVPASTACTMDTLQRVCKLLVFLAELSPPQLGRDPSHEDLVRRLSGQEFFVDFNNSGTDARWARTGL